MVNAANAAALANFTDSLIWSPITRQDSHYAALIDSRIDKRQTPYPDESPHCFTHMKPHALTLLPRPMQQSGQAYMPASFAWTPSPDSMRLPPHHAG
jgi:hypothetical protein